MKSSAPILTPRYVDAVGYATAIHATQVRKGTSVPYIAHLLAVSSLVLEAGGDEDEAIAGLLHDSVEDCGGLARAADVRARFGDRVADIVLGCSDSTDERWKSSVGYWTRSVASSSAPYDRRCQFAALVSVRPNAKPGIVATPWSRTIARLNASASSTPGSFAST